MGSGAGISGGFMLRRAEADIDDDELAVVEEGGLLGARSEGRSLGLISTALACAPALAPSPATCVVTATGVTVGGAKGMRIGDWVARSTHVSCSLTLTLPCTTVLSSSPSLAGTAGDVTVSDPPEPTKLLLLLMQSLPQL